MGIIRVKLSFLTGLLFLGLTGLMSMGCNQGESTKFSDHETTSLPKTKPEPVEERPVLKNMDDSIAALLICRGDKIRLRKDPSQNGEVLGSLKRNDLLLSLGEKSSHRDQFTFNNHSFDEPWIKVKALGPGFSEKVGWVYGAIDQEHGLFEWLMDEKQSKKQEQHNRQRKIILQATRAELAKLFKLKGLNNREAKAFSGYYYINSAEALDGPFFVASVTSNDRHSRILIEGDFREGNAERILMTRFEPPAKHSLELKLENGTCSGREYLKFKGAKRVMKYSDLECSLDESTISYDY